MNIVEQLTKIMVGKRVMKVEEPHACEAIALFTLSDGTRFRLHATDLGAWVEPTCPCEGPYEDLTVLLRDYYHHVIGP